MPFGEEILAGVGERDAVNLKYSASGIDNVRQRFTGYQKDEETGNIDTALDFAEARMYQNRHGRFTAPDPLLSSASLDNPQTFNRYVYVGNNPVNLTDPSGLDWCGNANGVATFRPGACDNPGDRATSARASANGFDSNGRTVTEGETVDLHDDGTLTVRRPITQQEEAQVARHTGAEVRGASDPALLTTSSIISSTVQTRSTDIYPALTINEPPEPLVSETTLDTIQLTLAGLGQIPGPGEVADVIDTLISLARGDYVGAGAGVLSVIPVIGNAAGAAKIARKLERLTDAAGDAKKVHNNPTPVSTKEAVKEAHKEVGKQTERGKGSFGSPMRGNSRKGYRLDPPHPNGKGLEKTHKHVNWWDYTKGKRKSPKGRQGYIPIKSK